MEHFPATELTIPSRFRGPEHSGNGGWSAGALAALVENDCPANRAETWPPIEVTLLPPPPLDVPLPVDVDAHGPTTAPFGRPLILPPRRHTPAAPTPGEPVSADA